MLIGGEPFQLVRLQEESLARIHAWTAGAPVGDGGALARALVMANLAQPSPPARSVPVSAVIPVRDRSVARLLAALEGFDDVIVVDDASVDGDSVRREAENARAHYIRREVRGGAGAARNEGLAVAQHDLVALIDSDCVPRPGWLEPVLAHFADPDVDVVAPRIVPLEPGASGRSRPARAVARYEAGRSPLDRGPDPARVVPGGRVPFVPGATLVVRRHLRFDPAFDQGGEDVDLIRRANYVRYEPAGLVAHDHRVDPGKWLRRRVYYGRTAAPLAKRHPRHARPLPVSLWTTAAWAAAAARRPRTALAITATATALLSRELPPKLALDLAAAGTLRSGWVVADAIARAWWPASLLLAVAAPKARLPIALAFVASSRANPLKLADDLAFGYGVWRGCLTHRTLAPITPAKPWRLARRRL